MFKKIKIMSEIKFVEVAGFTKEEALSTVEFNTSLQGANATQAWIKAGSPEVDSKAFKLSNIYKHELYPSD